MQIQRNTEEHDVTTVGESRRTAGWIYYRVFKQRRSYTAQLYSSPVRYTDEDGELNDIDTSLKKIGHFFWRNNGSENHGVIWWNSRYKWWLRIWNKRKSRYNVSPETLTSDTPILVTTDDYSIQLLPIASTKDATLDTLADQVVAEDKAV
jgi:hypothetical protein